MTECQGGWEVLNLDFTRRPEDDELWTCLHNTKGPGIKAEKEENTPKRGFTKYTYEDRDGKPFTLKTTIGGGSSIPGIQNSVEYVKIYYWNGDGKMPVLLEIRDKTKKTKYYSYSYNTGEKKGYWSYVGNDAEKGLVHLLDWRNCSFHAAIPFDIQNPTDPSKLYTDKKVPPCIENYRNIRESGSQYPQLTIPGYDIKEYNVHNNDKNPPGSTISTKISRVTFGQRDTNIIPPKDSISKIRIYQWKHGPDGSSSSIPLLVEFIDGNQQSTFFENLSKESLTWRLVGDETKFYKNGSPQETLTKKLDKINCDLNDAVKIDVSKTKGEYCHVGHIHSNSNQKISIREVNKDNLGNYRAFEHTPNPKSIGKPKTLQISGFTNGYRHKIELKGLTLPVIDVKKVVVYFCGKEVTGSTGRNPLLICIDSERPDKRKWFQKPENGIEWILVPSLNEQNDQTCEKIVGILDTLASKCKPPEVIIDIYQRSSSGVKYYQYTDPSYRGTILVTGVRDSHCFTEYRHTISGRTMFNVDQFVYNNENIKGDLNKNMAKVKEVSVYYWYPLETDARKNESRPLLVKLTQKEPGGKNVDTYYENVGKYGDLNWKPTAINSSSELQKKLQLLNCRLNYAIIIDVSKTEGETYDACDNNDKTNLDNPHSNRMQVTNDHTDGQLGRYSVYSHILNKGPGPFHIVGFQNGPQWISIGKTSYSSPILDVDLVKVYFCQKESKRPFLIYYTIYGSHFWYKKNGSSDNEDEAWTKVDLPDITPDNLESLDCTKYSQLTQVLKDAGSSISPFPQPSALAPSESQVSTPDSTVSEPEAPSEEGEAQAIVEPFSTAATGMGLIASSVLGASGSITGFTYWIYKRFAGSEPWVRQI